MGNWTYSQNIGVAGLSITHNKTILLGGGERVVFEHCGPPKYLQFWSNSNCSCFIITIIITSHKIIIIMGISRAKNKVNSYSGERSQSTKLLPNNCNSMCWLHKDHGTWEHQPACVLSRPLARHQIPWGLVAVQGPRQYTWWLILPGAHNDTYRHHRNITCYDLLYYYSFIKNLISKKE